MNTSKRWMATLMSIIAALIVVSCAAPKDTIITSNNPSVNVSELMENQQYVFHAETMNPSGGRMRQLTTEYSVNVSRESVVSFLPYFGRAYAATLGAESGIKFTSAKFEYLYRSNKKGKWDITIRPTDVPDVRQLNLIVYDNGAANLQVISNNRQTISYRGYIDKQLQ